MDTASKTIRTYLRHFGLPLQANGQFRVQPDEGPKSIRFKGSRVVACLFVNSKIKLQ